MEQSSRSGYLTTYFLLLGTALAFLTVYSSKWGLAAFPDSVSYLEAALNFQQGHGISLLRAGEYVPLIHFPPLLPALIGEMSHFTSPSTAFLIINVLAAILTVLAYGTVFQSLFTNRYLACAILTLFALTPATLELYSSALSEPLYVCFQALSFAALVNFIRQPSLRWTLLLAAPLSAALLTRYAGAALFVFCTAALLIGGKGPLKARLKFLGPMILALLPLICWFLAAPQSGAIRDRSVSFHPPHIAYLLGGLKTLAAWFIPTDLLGPYGGELLGGILIAGCILHFATTYSLLSGFALCYLLFILFSITFLDAETPLNSRILFPIFPSLLANLASIASRERIIPVVKILFVGLILVSGIRSITLAHRLHEEGSGFNSRAWAESETIAAVGKLPADSKIYSNAPDLLLIRLSKTSLSLPAWINAGTRKERSEFPAEIAALGQDLKASPDAFVVYFRKISWRWYIPSDEQLQQLLPLTKVQELADGAIFKIVR